VYVGNSDEPTANAVCAANQPANSAANPLVEVTCTPPVAGSYLYIYLPRQGILTLCEVEVIGRDWCSAGKSVGRVCMCECVLLHYCFVSLSLYKFFTPAFTPAVLICICFTPVCSTPIYIYMYIYMYVYIYIYVLLLFYSCFTTLYIYNCCNPALLKYMYIYSCFTRTLLVLLLLCVCMCVCIIPVVLLLYPQYT
jgi:hypothetical protein